MFLPNFIRKFLLEKCKLNQSTVKHINYLIDLHILYFLSVLLSIKIIEDPLMFSFFFGLETSMYFGFVLQKLITKGIQLEKFLMPNVLIKLTKDYIKNKWGSYSVKRHPFLPRSYTVSYSLNGKPYKIIVESSPSSVNILAATDALGNDWTEELLSHLGPAGDGHRMAITPSMIGCYANLKVYDRLGLMRLVGPGENI